MKHQTKALVFLICITLFSCGQEKSRTQLEFIKTISFKTGFIQSDFITTYYDESTQTDYVYIADKYNKKCIKRFLLDGSYIDSISLKKVNQITAPYISNIKVIIPKTLDTTIILSTYSNQIISINNSGDIIHDFKIDKILPDSAKNNYEFVYRSCTNKIIENKLLFFTEPLYAYIADRIEDKTHQARAICFLTQVLNYPCFFEIDLPNEINNTGINYRFENKNFWKNLNIYSGEGEYIDHTPVFIHDLYHIYFITKAKNCVYKIDLSDFSIINEYKITSDYGEIGAKLIKVYTGNNIAEYESRIKASALDGVTNNIIKEIFYNPEKEHFYLMLAMKINGFDEIDNPGRNFSILVYDKEFNKLGEHFFKREEYRDMNSICLTSQGLLIQRRPKNLTRENYGTQTFDLFKIN